MRHSRFAILAAGVCCFASSIQALDYQVNFTASAPTIDGTIDAAWATAATEMTGFVSSTAVGTASDQQTRVRALWNKDKLFLLYEADDVGIVAPATANDTGFNLTTQDAAEIILDPAWRQGGTGVTNRVYRICVNPAAGAYTLTEAGLGQAVWDLGVNSQAAFSSSGNNWVVELAIAWTDLNSLESNSPGVVVGPPSNGSIWGAQFARFHSAGNNANSTKWHPIAGAAVARPLGTLTFAGAAAASAISLPDLTPLYSTSFEAPEFTATATPSGIEGWITSYPEIFTVTDSEAETGVQGVEVSASANGRTLLSPPVPSVENSHVLQYAVKMPEELGNNTYRHVLYVNGRYNDDTTQTATQVWFYGAGNSVGGNSIRVSEYLNPNGTTATNYHFVGLAAFDEWSYITVRTDGFNNTFEVWYNDTKLVYPGTTGVYKPRNPGQFMFMNRATLYSKNYGTDSAYLDSFTHYSIPGETSAADWQMFE